MWHIHEYEVKSDVLFLPGVPGPVEQQDREKALKTYGKTIHFFGRYLESRYGVLFKKERDNRAYMEGLSQGIHSKAHADGAGLKTIVQDINLHCLETWKGFVQSCYGSGVNMSKTNSEKIAGLEAEVLQAINNLTKTVKGKLIQEEEKGKEDPEFELEFGSFKKGPKDDKNKGGGRKIGEFQKIKAPIFEGEDAFGWIYKVERFFEIQDIGVRDRLKAATICLDGKALAWFRWSQARDPFRSWEDLKERLLERFQLTGEGNLYHQFLAIPQEGTVRDYVSNFERLSCQLGDIPEIVLEVTFINGLKDDTRSAVRILQPANLARAMTLAVMIDENKFSIGTPKTSGGNFYLKQHLTILKFLNVNNIRDDIQKEDAFRGLCAMVKVNTSVDLSSLVFLCRAISSWHQLL
ncbi:unnamed protein product [Lactuca saligna]|uniref:Retrotransposon gag domain-containing protein n=1 Tax=Lactuca saligna TaxID=75948 RepID=A0AA36EGS2_LACSI|nr:unnamed protein product [Lactuca saligna]